MKRQPALPSAQMSWLCVAANDSPILRKSLPTGTHSVTRSSPKRWPPPHSHLPASLLGGRTTEVTGSEVVEVKVEAEVVAGAEVTMTEEGTGTGGIITSRGHMVVMTIDTKVKVTRVTTGTESIIRRDSMVTMTTEVKVTSAVVEIVVTIIVKGNTDSIETAPLIEETDTSGKLVCVCVCVREIERERERERRVRDIEGEKRNQLSFDAPPRGSCMGPPI
ncbi:hypothetical protein V1264_005537 [Littorina saxatilis]|uniref:Uncharacterized protein n=1 Tax=Littorina saxatilis TaxID=31220 RepID=A0AAN9AZD4_9CAEN